MHLSTKSVRQSAPPGIPFPRRSTGISVGWCDRNTAQSLPTLRQPNSLESGRTDSQYPASERVSQRQARWKLFRIQQQTRRLLPAGGRDRRCQHAQVIGRVSAMRHTQAYHWRYAKRSLCGPPFRELIMTDESMPQRSKTFRPGEKTFTRQRSSTLRSPPSCMGNRGITLSNGATDACGR